VISKDGYGDCEISGVSTKDGTALLASCAAASTGFVDTLQ
jgi:hypothetical protein